MIFHGACQKNLGCMPILVDAIFFVNSFVKLHCIEKKGNLDKKLFGRNRFCHSIITSDFSKMVFRAIPKVSLLLDLYLFTCEVLGNEKLPTVTSCKQIANKLK